MSSPRRTSRPRDETRLVLLSPGLEEDPHFEEHIPHHRPAWATSYLPFPSLSRRRRARRPLAVSVPPCAVQALGCLRRRPKWSMHLLGGFVVLFLLWHLWTGSPLPFMPASTRVFAMGDIRRIWEWEIASGHYQSVRKIPPELELKAPLLNPGLPQEIPSSSRNIIKHQPAVTTVGVGLRRTYFNLQNTHSALEYPPRPVAGSIADLDIVMDHCDFSNNKYVRDCLEVLRAGAGLDNGRRVRRGNMEEWNYIYVEQGKHRNRAGGRSVPEQPTPRSAEFDPPLRLPRPLPYRTTSELSSACDPDHPRIFHMFWRIPFTDKPYMLLLSFLFTQNLGLHTLSPMNSTVCRPQVWVWIQTGPAHEASPKPTAEQDMLNSLRYNAWSAPFLHSRFKDLIKFKLWNVTEQLDAVDELKDEWRNHKIFDSGPPVVPSSKRDNTLDPQTVANDTTVPSWEQRGAQYTHRRRGFMSSPSYDLAQTILSDVARFVLCHRFGGIYMDADSLFLRDWEELWGWKGAFAYRWSRLPIYNTAVLKLNKGSALGSFILRTGLRHGLNFHPKLAVSFYMKDAYLEDLLLRLPDALFDPAWLTTEKYQRDRPPTPYFTNFKHFFNTPTRAIGEPQVLGFEGFFRGAFSYHWHNLWWKPTDPARNWPDLGERFKTEYVRSPPPSNASSKRTPEGGTGGDEQEEVVWRDSVADDKSDLDWATVIKRTFESYIRGERPNMYGEWIAW